MIGESERLGAHGGDAGVPSPAVLQDRLAAFDRRAGILFLVVDMVYGDERTKLLTAAESSGATVIDGIEVLVQQGALSFEIWTNHKPPLDIMRTAARAQGPSR